jgi:hypothetical protein
MVDFLHSPVANVTEADPQAKRCRPRRRRGRGRSLARAPRSNAEPGWSPVRPGCVEGVVAVAIGPGALEAVHARRHGSIRIAWRSEGLVGARRIRGAIADIGAAVLSARRPAGPRACRGAPRDRDKRQRSEPTHDRKSTHPRASVTPRRFRIRPLSRCRPRSRSTPPMGSLSRAGEAWVGVGAGGRGRGSRSRSGLRVGVGAALSPRSP